MNGEQKHMNKRWIFLLIGGVLLAVIAAFCVLYFGLQISALDQSGWSVTEFGTYQYLNYYGRPLEEWQEIDGSRYYFAPESGEMVTGWLETEQGIFYFSPTGQMQTGFIEEEHERYYLMDNGTLGIGWIETPDGRCYADQDGKLLTGWLELEDIRYYLDVNGAAVTGWLTLPEGRYYLQQDGSCATGNVEVNGTIRFFLETGEYVPLVNPWNKVPGDYTLNLVEIDEFQLDAGCKEPLLQMLADCEAAGYDCGINSAYRSMETQQQLWDERYEEYTAAGYDSEEAITLTSREVAVPGTSEHHLGLAVDISGLAETYAWLEEHSWEYGFVRRYPDEKLEVTGIVYEPWHYRYVGRELAQQLYNAGLCLEEYLEQ